MVQNEDDLHSMLMRLDRHFEKLEDGTFLVAAGPGQVPVALRLAPPVLVAQVGIGPAPANNPALEARVFRRLLEHNASDLLHASYAIEGQDIALAAALELESLDLNELEAVLADMGMALSEHVPELREMVQTKA